MSILHSELLPSIISLAESAATEILKFYQSEFSIQKKDDNTPVTDADLAGHNVIFNGLKKLTPDIPILSEEGAPISFEERQRWNTYWLVDPLDGTREFIKQNGEFTINIALIDNQQAVFGVIYVPVTQVCYYAIKNSGAFKIENQGEPAKISVRKAPKDTVHVAGSRSYFDTSIKSYLQHLGNYELTKMGSSLKSCMVAEGKIDIYPRLGLTSEWDTAAAQCIVEEAGGFITTTNLEPLRYNTKESLLNPHFLVFGDKDVDWPSYI